MQLWPHLNIWLAGTNANKACCPGGGLYPERYLQFVDLGGLSLVELAKRTARASWRNAVFGQGSRMAFYHFLAIFSALLLALALGARVPDQGAQLRATIWISRARYYRGMLRCFFKTH